jgi:hypothetical protein
MEIRLEELRRRLLEPSALMTSPSAVYQQDASGGGRNRAEGTTEFPVRTGRESFAPGAQVFAVRRRPRRGVAAAMLQYVRRNPAVETQFAPSHQELTQSIAEIFDRMHGFEARASSLRAMIDPVKRAVELTAQAADPLRGFEERILEVANAFETAITAQSRVTLLARSFEPIQYLEKQVAQFAHAFGDHLKRLATALDETDALRTELVTMVEALSPMEKLRGRLAALSSDCQRRMTSAVEAAAASGGGANGGGAASNLATSVA